MDKLGQADLHHLVVDVVGSPSLMLVDQVKRVPAEVNALGVTFRLAVGRKGLVQKLTDVEVHSLL